MSYETLVIGSRPRDLYRALKLGAYFVFNKPMPIESLVRHPGSQGPIWEQLYWKLFYRGDIFTEIASSVSVSEDMSTNIVTRFGTEALDFRPKQIHISCLENIELPLGACSVKSCTNKVYDFFEVNKGSVHDIWQLSRKSKKLIKSIQFYLSDRIDGNSKRKDLFAVSSLSDDDLRKFEYSDTMVRFELESILGEALGKSEKIKLKHFHREVERTYTLKVPRVSNISIIPSDQPLKEIEIESIK